MNCGVAYGLFDNFVRVEERDDFFNVDGSFAQLGPPVPLSDIALRFSLLSPEIFLVDPG